MGIEQEINKRLVHLKTVEGLDEVGALNKLGQMYRYGGVPQHSDFSLECYRRAGEIEKAQKMAREWKPSN